MFEIRIRLIINSLATAIAFGLWVNSLPAGVFVFLLLGFTLSAIDYVFVKLKTGE